jgi:hypothetical protein
VSASSAPSSFWPDVEGTSRPLENALVRKGRQQHTFSDAVASRSASSPCFFAPEPPRPLLARYW